jgi:hypothetical protein
MFHPVCEVCGQPAMIHETAIEGGVAVTRHLCQAHGQAALPALNHGLPQDAQELYQNLSDAEKEYFALLFRLSKLQS